MRVAKIILSGLVAVFVLLQLVPVDRANPETTMDIPAPDDVKAVLRQSCYDCHSNETVWRWYAYVAPISWRVSDHVKEGRKHLNFSTWDDYSDEQREHRLEEAVEEIEEGKMPLKDYLLLHRDAAVSDADLSLLRKWVSATLGGEDADD